MVLLFTVQHCKSGISEAAPKHELVRCAETVWDGKYAKIEQQTTRESWNREWWNNRNGAEQLEEC